MLWMDEIHFPPFPPKKPWFLMIPLSIINKCWFPMVSKWCRISSHPQYVGCWSLQVRLLFVLVQAGEWSIFFSHYTSPPLPYPNPPTPPHPNPPTKPPSHPRGTDRLGCASPCFKQVSFKHIPVRIPCLRKFLSLQKSGSMFSAIVIIPRPGLARKLAHVPAYCQEPRGPFVLCLAGFFS